LSEEPFLGLVGRAREEHLRRAWMYRSVIDIVSGQPRVGLRVAGSGLVRRRGWRRSCNGRNGFVIFARFSAGRM
jgi:hypothetical protein